MTHVAEEARRLLGRRSTGGVVGPLEGLQTAVDAARGRLPDELVERAASVAGRARSRLSLSGDHTVVALAGATGSGKSSTFNALTDMDFAAVGVRRPTTSWTMSCVWGRDKADELLDWLEIPGRHRVSLDSMLGSATVDRDLEGLVLLDLPDHDSTEIPHHVEVERLVELADLMVWVLDPQKYADAAIHDRFLRPLARHTDNMLVVLNHIDEVPADRRDIMVADLRRLLDNDGLHGVPVLMTSAKYGDGIDELKQVVASRVTTKKAMLDRVAADVRAAALGLEDHTGAAKPGDIARQSKAELVDSFADAAGVPTVVRAVEKSTARRAARRTGWPLTKWLVRLRPDPLSRLHLDLGPDAKQLTATARTSLPEATPVQRARVDTAVRKVADNVAAELAPHWAQAVRRASTSRLDELGDSLDKAIASTDLGVRRTPAWWRLVQVLQLILFVAAVAGGMWLAAVGLSDYLGVDVATPPTVLGLALPAVLFIGGIAVGVLLAIWSRALGRLAARSKARGVDRRLREAISDVTEELVVEPIEAEVDAYRRARHGLNEALR